MPSIRTGNRRRLARVRAARMELRLDGLTMRLIRALRGKAASRPFSHTFAAPAFTMETRGTLYEPKAVPPGALREWLRSKLKKGVVR